LSGMKRSELRKVALITGSGVTEQFTLLESKKVSTEYGMAEVFTSAEGPLVLPRHGRGHAVPPHAVNYRANVAALNRLGVQGVVATNAVGSMIRSFGIGRLGLVDQFIDFTRTRKSTFFEDRVVHTDMTRPYSEKLNSLLLEASRRVGIRLARGLVYVCVEGPRYETPAEIRMFRKMGGDVVGMTGVPEVVLARELGMEYSAVAVATNFAAGMQTRVSHEEVLDVMKKAGTKVRKLLLEAINLI
jgi:5'-methylthioadenosine phosphorylase